MPVQIKRGPEGRIVAITDRRIAEIPRQVDELIFGLEGAEALINAIRGSEA